MTGEAAPPKGVIAACVLIAGVLVAVLPQYGVGIFQIALTTVAVTAGLTALSVVPEWSGLQRWSPFDGPSRRRSKASSPVGVARIHAALSGQRVVIPGSPPLPMEVLRLLQPLIRDAVERAGGEASLSQLTRAVYRADSKSLRTWAQTRRRNVRSVSEVVHHVLNDLERLANPDPRS